MRSVRGMLLFVGIGAWLLPGAPRMPVLVWIYAALAAAVLVADGLDLATGWVSWLTAVADGMVVGLLVSAVVGPVASSVAMTAAGAVAREGGIALGAMAMVWLTARHGVARHEEPPAAEREAA